MKLRVIVLLIVTIASWAVPAAAQKGTWSMGFNLISASTNAETEPGQQTDSSVTIGDGYAIGFEGTYGLTRTVAVELSLSTGERDLGTTGGALDGVGAGSFWVMPATVTAKWMIPMYGHFSPYVGGGVTYPFSHSYERTDALSTLGIYEVEIKGRAGLALQAGVDYDVTERWYCTIDLKYLDLSGELELRRSNGSLFQRLELDGNQFQIEAGFGFRF